jgi:hypothetical protein
MAHASLFLKLDKVGGAREIFPNHLEYETSRDVVACSEQLISAALRDHGMEADVRFAELLLIASDQGQHRFMRFCHRFEL